MASQEDTAIAISLKDNIKSFVSKDNLTRALQTYLCDDDAQLQDFHVDVATDEVQGFLSCILRVKLVYQRDGKQQVKPVIVKRMPLVKVQIDIVKEMRVFKKEAKAYTLIIKDMEAITDKMCLKVPVAECYHVLIDGNKDELILEDLCSSGFKNHTYRELFDIPHFEVSLKALATFHALSVVVEKEKGRPLNEVYDFMTEGIFTSHMYKTLPYLGETIKGIVEFAKLMSQYEKIIPELQKRCDVMFDDLCEVFKPGESLNVILHGDIHAQNIMFRYENERPVEVKFIDLQEVRYGSPVLDLLCLFYQSCHRSTRDEHIDELLSIYHSQFSSVLNSAGVVVNNFSLDDLKKEYCDKRIHGLFFAAMAVPTLNMSEDIFPKDYENSEDIEKLFNESVLLKQIEQFKNDAEYRGLVETVIEEIVEVMGLMK